MHAASGKRKILVVDDEADVRTYLIKFLQENGFETSCAGNGEEALESLKTNRPDLITLDISMPNKSGIKFYREIKDDSAFSSIPVVVVTGVTGFGGNPEDFRHFLNTRKQVPPPAGFLAKPVELNELLELIRKLTKI